MATLEDQEKHLKAMIAQSRLMMKMGAAAAAAKASSTKAKGDLQKAQQELKTAED
jgi:hypothetical protein